MDKEIRKTIAFTIPGKPIAQKRPRFARIGNNVRTYSDQHTEAGKFLLQCLKHMPEKPIQGAIRLDCMFVFQRPKSHFGSGKNSAVLKSSAPVHKTSKPDCTNLSKFVEDCLNGHAWVDDSQIVVSMAEKYWEDDPDYGYGGGYTRVTITEI